MKAIFNPTDSSELVDFSTIDLLEKAAREAGDRIALKRVDFNDRSKDEIWTYDELVTDAKTVGLFIASQCERGDHIAIIAPTSTSWTLIQLGAAYAGVPLVTLNPALQSGEIDYQLSQSQARLLFAAREYRGHNLEDTLTDLLPNLTDLEKIIYMDECADKFASFENSDTSTLQPAKPEDTALVIFTSGTTGKPKAVQHTHKGVINNAKLGGERYELGEGKVWLNTLPMFHIGGAVTSTLGCMAFNSTHIVMTAFDPPMVLKLIESEKVNWIPVVPTMVHAMIEHEDFESTDLSSIEFVLTGGTTIAPEFVKLIKQKFNCGVQVMFGQTEAGGAMTKTWRNDSEDRICNTVGVAYPQTAIKIQDSEKEEICNVGEIGEIRIKSPFMMKGYLNNPDATKQAFDADGFLRTGDLGTLDKDGYLQITGRLKEMIIRGGENIYPREVEDVLVEHKAVAECAVVGIPSEKWGEEVAVIVRFVPGQSTDEAALFEYLSDKIARYKIPRIWKFVDDFPRTAMGKIQKFELAKHLAEEK